MLNREGLKLYTELGDRAGIAVMWEKTRQLRQVATARAAVGTSAFDVVWAERRALRLEQAIATALKQASEKET